MIRVLIVDDQPTKVAQAKSLILSVVGNAEFEHVKDYLGAEALLDTFPWDLVILDMSFSVNHAPSETVGFVGLAGLEVLQHILRADILTSAIIFTAHSDFNDQYISIGSFEHLEDHVDEFFSTVCLGCIYSKAEFEENHIRLKSLIPKKMITGIEEEQK